ALMFVTDVQRPAFYDQISALMFTFNDPRPMISEQQWLSAARSVGLIQPGQVLLSPSSDAGDGSTAAWENFGVFCALIAIPVIHELTVAASISVWIVIDAVCAVFGCVDR